MAFVQIIEIETTHPMRSRHSSANGEQRPRNTEAQRGTFTKDRDRPDTYVQIVEFPS